MVQHGSCSSKELGTIPNLSWRLIVAVVCKSPILPCKLSLSGILVSPATVILSMIVRSLPLELAI